MSIDKEDQIKTLRLAAIAFLKRAAALQSDGIGKDHVIYAANVIAMAPQELPASAMAHDLEERGEWCEAFKQQFDYFMINVGRSTNSSLHDVKLTLDNWTNATGNLESDALPELYRVADEIRGPFDGRSKFSMRAYII